MQQLSATKWFWQRARTTEVLVELTRKVKYGQQSRLSFGENCYHQSYQDDSGTSTINSQLPSPKNEIAPEITSNVNTPLQQNKRNISFEERQQFIYRIEPQMSGLKSHMKCEISKMSSKIDLLSDFVNTKINNLNDQQKVL